jgi:hypothetical protein
MLPPPPPHPHPPLAQVVHGAALLYVDTALALPRLGPRGAAQVAADAEYISNVLSALAVAPPPQLLSLQLFAALPAEQWGEVAGAAVADGSGDGRVLRLLAGLRGIHWQQQQQQGVAVAGGGRGALGAGEGEGAASTTGSREGASAAAMASAAPAAGVQ